MKIIILIKIMKIIILIKNFFVPQHVSNTIIIGQSGCSKTNLLFNILTLNPVFQKIFIFTKEPEAKYNFLIKNFLKI